MSQENTSILNTISEHHAIHTISSGPMRHLVIILFVQSQQHPACCKGGQADLLAAICKLIERFWALKKKKAHCETLGEWEYHNVRVSGRGFQSKWQRSMDKLYFTKNNCAMQTRMSLYCLLEDILVYTCRYSICSKQILCLNYCSHFLASYSLHNKPVTPSNEQKMGN